MMTLICVGKIKEPYLMDMIEDYRKRINKYHKLEIVEVKDSHKEEEAERILKCIPTSSYVITLEIEGHPLSSLELATKIDECLMRYAHITFIIGSSEGLDERVRKRSNFALSFGKNTFPHGLFRGVLLEQIYRSFKIIRNETYHK